MISGSQINETKLRMSLSLKNQIKTKPFSKVTVSDIISDCKMNRNTFYYHFENMYDLLYWTYAREVENIVLQFREANANTLDAMEFVFNYIDENMTLCRCAYDSLGETELRSIFDEDLKTFTSTTIEYFVSQNGFSVSIDFKTLLSVMFTEMLCSQIIWFIKNNEWIDKPRFRSYIYTAFYSSLEATLRSADKNGQ